MKIIDIHTHGIGGFDTRTVSKNEILQIAKLHHDEGTTGFLPTIYPSSIEAMRQNMDAIKKAIEFQRENPETASIKGIYLEGPFINPLRMGALDGSSFLEADEDNLERLIDGFEDVIKIITIAPEIRGAVRLIKRIAERGIIASMGHSDASFSEAEAGYNAGARGITHIFNAMRDIHHREPGIAAFGLLHNDIYIEVIADPFHLDPKIMELIFRVKNPYRIILVSDSVKETKRKNIVDRITDDKNILLGGSALLKESAERLMKAGISGELVMNAISDNPARYLGQ